MNTFVWTCPYCGHENKTMTENYTELLYCNSEEGGCDRFVVVEFIVKTYTKVRKVEPYVLLEGEDGIDEFGKVQLVYHLDG